MQKFLKEVAGQIYSEHSDSMENQVLVFPNRRSSLYFRMYLSKLIDIPTLLPESYTINRLMTSHSSLKVADPLQLVTKLYEAYIATVPAYDTFDEFYFWGEMLVNDFDDIDKYRVDSSLIFRNLRDLREIDARFSGFEPEVIEVIREFWRNFDSSTLTDEKSDFLAVWDVLKIMYDRYRDILHKSGFAYEGMLMREYIESLDSGELDPSEEGRLVYHFIGFNALNRCEKDLMRFLKSRNSARFYWDYDKLYLAEQGHEAGFFIKENLELFGQDMQGMIRFDNLIGSKPAAEWEVVRAPSDVAQAKLLPELLAGIESDVTEPDRVAIILADENMLIPVLNSLPDGIPGVNITMGYPLGQTPVASLIDALVGLRRNMAFKGEEPEFYYQDILKVLSHQYIAFNSGDFEADLMSEIREQNLIRVKGERLAASRMAMQLFSVQAMKLTLNGYLSNIMQELLAVFEENNSEDDSSGAVSMQQEYILIALKALKQLNHVLEGSVAKPGDEIFKRVLDRIIKSLTVPFEGEPLKGIQVMGVLETRSLDFDRVIFLSVNEGIIPRSSAGNSYIPYNLRMAFGLPTIKHQDSIYAYYFYRLLQRSSGIRFVYNSSAAGTRTGEMSRFLLQLKYSPSLKPVFRESRFNIMPQAGQADAIERTGEMHSVLTGKYISEGKVLSPSALNTWINCRMRFYYRYIAGLSEPQDVTEEVDAPLFGTILHEVMNSLYGDFKGRLLEQEDIEMLRKDTAGIAKIVEDSFRKHFMSNREGAISGRNLIITSVVQNMAERIIEVDKRFAPLGIIDLETESYSTINGKSVDTVRGIKVGGIIDRIDITGGVIRILDYKSGREKLQVDTLESLTTFNTRNRNSAAFQTFLYTMVYADRISEGTLRPSLYPVRSIYRDDFDDHFSIRNGDHRGVINDFSAIADDFRELVISVLDDMFNPSRAFDMTTVTDSCRYCPYAGLCRRTEL